VEKGRQEMAKIIREQHKEIEYLKRQRDVASKKNLTTLAPYPVKKAMSIPGKNRIPVCDDRAIVGSIRPKGHDWESERRYMHDPESFANERHLFVKRSILEALPTKVIPVSSPPIRQRSISFSFVVGELLGDFIEGHDKDVNSFNNRYRDTVSIENNRMISSLRQRLLLLFITPERRASRCFYAVSYEHRQLIGHLPGVPKGEHISRHFLPVKAFT
jgi:hypothetical protein